MENITQPSHPRQSKTLEHPAAQTRLNGDLNPMLAIRRQRAMALVPTVRPTDGGYRVASSGINRQYLISQPNGHRVCTCPDYQKYAQEPGFKCKHIQAVEIGLEQGTIPPMEKGIPAASVAGPQFLTLAPVSSGSDEPVRVKLIKNTKGYSWEISVAHQNGEQALAQAKALEAQVRAAFGSAEAA